MNILAQIESILFVASKPLSYKKIAAALGKQEADIEEQIENLKMKYNVDHSGIHILVDHGQVQMATNPEHAEIIEGFIKDEISGELTKAQLETLTVIAYRSPISRPEIEELRGVNCSVILRNLLMRGLIREVDDKEALLPTYALSIDALRALGISGVEELPDFEQLHAHEHIEQALANAQS